MTVRMPTEDIVELAGQSGVEDAEVLQRYLLACPGAAVEWSACEHLHAAVLQVLLAAKPSVRGMPSNAFLRAHIGPLIGAP